MNEVFYKDEEKGYYLSYLAVPSEYCQRLDRTILEMFGKDGAEGVGNPETAICILEPWQCLILYGDHREGYKPIANDLEACKKYFKDHQEELMGHSSDTLDEDNN